MSDKLPNADKAVVESSKLTDYLLSLDHPEGKGKAKYFMQFGFGPPQADVMESAMLNHAVTQPVVQVKQSEHGVKYVIKCSVLTPDKRNPCIFSIWIVDAGKTMPRFVTAYPN